VTSNEGARGLKNRLAVFLFREFGQLRPRQHFFSAISRALPLNVGAEARSSLLRLRGIRVGARTLVHGTPELTGGEARGFETLSIGDDCVIEAGCAFEVGDALSIGNAVTIGHGVLIITTTHELGPPEHRCGPPTRSPVKIEDGAMIGPRCTILPGVTVGAGAVVDAGSVVNKSVPPNARVRGIPAKQVEELR
jgi:maltose O-acetyltransferase